MNTIVALSSGRPPAAIAVVRVSGPGAFVAVTALAGQLPPARRASLRALRDGGGALLDRALVLIFPGPGSATGEDLVELHCHGGRAVTAAVIAALTACTDVREAEPGEFTRRALVNGRIDLAQAEGLADLLEAETQAQRRAALAASEGRVSSAVRGWMATLADLSARVEATLDHAEEGDVGEEAALIAGVHADARTLRDAMLAALAAPPVERVREGVRVVIGGPPNAGKSTLLNLLSGREAAQAPIKPRRIYALSSGMMTEHTLSNIFAQRMMADARNSIFFVGYADPDSPAGRLRAAQPGDMVQLDEEAPPVARRCQVEVFDFSAHSQREDILNYILRVKPKKVLLVHGDPGAIEWFKSTLAVQAPGMEVIVPPPGVALEL